MQTEAADLWVCVVTAVVALTLVFLPGVPPVVSLVVGIPFVLLVPGYAIVACIFPRAGETTPRGEGRHSWASRLALSAGASVVVVGAVAGALDFTVWGFRRGTVAVGLTLVTVLAAGIAGYRRRRVPAQARVSVPLRTVLTRARSAAVGEGITGIVLTVIVLATAVGAAGVVAQEATSTGTATELFIVSPGEDGAPVAGAYPTNLTVDRPTELTVGVGVSGPDAFDGMVVGHLEQVSVDGDAVSITRQWEVARFAVDVEANDRTLVDHVVTPPQHGERLRLAYRLYAEGADRPLREVHIWVTVARPDNQPAISICCG